MTTSATYEGGCSCTKLRYRMKVAPLIVHACHCRQCQRVTGSAFVMNALVEKSEVELIRGATAHCTFPGTCHSAFYCPDCATYVWSEYASPKGSFNTCWFVRVGTLDEPDRFPPDVHIFTSSKQPWVIIPQDAPRYEVFYRIKELWSQSSQDRMAPYWQQSP
ncbi:MAG: GFA family protein, partial [Gammaproteobacteria bacterium]|nr:GFA family protein [Gammaproteobacteria bacterium]